MQSFLPLRLGSDTFIDEFIRLPQVGLSPSPAARGRSVCSLDMIVTLGELKALVTDGLGRSQFIVELLPCSGLHTIKGASSVAESSPRL